MKMHHCCAAIHVIAKDETNIFASLNPAETHRIWSIITALVLAMEMGKHFILMEAFIKRVHRQELNRDDPSDRELLLKMSLKCGDLPPIVRSFEFASKSCEEFFRQGDLEQAQVLQYTSTVGDREHLDKPKSQIGLYTSVCKPLFAAVAKVMPSFERTVKQFAANIEKWRLRQK
jgi:hypothetical protein